MAHHTIMLSLQGMTGTSDSLTVMLSTCYAISQRGPVKDGEKQAGVSNQMSSKVGAGKLPRAREMKLTIIGCDVERPVKWRRVERLIGGLDAS